MDYKKLAAAGMSAALMLSIGGSALAKAPGGTLPDAASGASVSISRRQRKPIERAAGRGS